MNPEPLAIEIDLYAEEGEDFYSDSIEAVGHNIEKKALYITFKSSPWNVYEYGGIEESVYNLFVGSDSLNSFWRNYIAAKHKAVARHDNAQMVFVSTGPETEEEPLADWARELLYGIDEEPDTFRWTATYYVPENGISVDVPLVARSNEEIMEKVDAVGRHLSEDEFEFVARSVTLHFE